MRTITYDIYNHVNIETRLHQFLYDIIRIFNPLKYLKDVNSHLRRKTAFTQTLKLRGNKFKLNLYNTSAEAQTTFLTFVRE